MPSSARNAISIVAYAVLLAATGWLIDQLAQHQFTVHLRDQAAHALMLAATGDTPYKWDSRPDSLVAGRVFGAASFDFADECLFVQAGGQPFEIGLQLRRPMPLQDFPRLRLYAFAGAPAQAQLVVRETLDSGEWLSAPFVLAGISTTTKIQLDQIEWHAPSNGRERMPTTAAMLRFRFSLPQGAMLQYNGADLESSMSLPRLRLIPPETAYFGGAPTPVHELPTDANLQKVEIAAIANNSAGQPPPVILLPQYGRIEQQMLALKAVHDGLPAAIVIPKSEHNTTFAQASRLMSADNPVNWEFACWIVVGLYALFLGVARWHPPRHARVRALVEIVLVLAVPLWLIVGGRFDGNPDMVQKLLIALTLIYAVSLSVPKHWRWNGSARAWLLAGAVVVLAMLLGLLAHRPDAPLRAVGNGHLARYLAWALLQQYLICAVCAERWRIVTGNAAIAAYLGALGFALMHTPNAALMLATLLGGLCWCALYLRERSLLPLAISHAASALVLLTLLPPDILASAEVSARFFQ